MWLVKRKTGEMSQTPQSFRSPYMSASARHSRRKRLTALTVTLAFAVSAALLHEFHSQTQVNARLGDAASPVPSTGPLSYFPR
jgi:hypothetical protein